MKRRTRISILCRFLFLAPLAASGQEAGYVIVEADIQSDYMQGFPPPADKILTRDSHFSAGGVEVARWTYQNMSQIRNVDVVARAGQVAELPYSDGHLLDVLVTGTDGEARSLREQLRLLKVDGFIVLSDGVIQTEAYYNGLKPDTHHIAFSVTKSFVGALALSLVDEGLIDLDKTAGDYLPELGNAAMGSATVRQVLDMQAGLDFDLRQQRATNSRAGGFTPRPPGFEFANTLEWIASLRPGGEHGRKYVYNPANTEVLGWIITRVLGQQWQEALAERIWSKLGMEHDALVVVDGQGHGFATAGLNATLRDFARFGLMISRHGAFNGNRVLSQAMIDDIRFGDDAAFAAWQQGDETQRFGNGSFYRSQFRVLDPGAGEIIAVGASGQMIYVNIEQQLVGVFLSTGAGEMDNAQVDLMRQLGARLAAD